MPKSKRIVIQISESFEQPSTKLKQSGQDLCTFSPSYLPIFSIPISDKRLKFERLGSGLMLLHQNPNYIIWILAFHCMYYHYKCEEKNLHKELEKSKKFNVPF